MISLGASVDDPFAPPNTEGIHSRTSDAAHGTSGLLVVTLIVGLVLRLLVWTWFAGVPLSTYDEVDYSSIAVNLLQRGEFAIKPGEPTSIRAPLYPTLVAAVYAVFGLENYQAVRLLQIAIDLLTAALVYRLASELYDSRVALPAAALCCFYPSLWGHNYLVLTEVLFTCLLCLAGLLLVRFFRKGRLTLIAAAGVVMGLAALTRSIMWPFVIPLVFFLLLAPRRLPLARRAGAALLFTSAFAATIAPWVVRNTRLQGTFTIIDTMARFWNSRLPTVQTTAGSAAGAPAGTEAAAEAGALRQLLELAVRRPWSFATHLARNFFEFWRLDRELIAGARQGHFGPISLAAVLALAALFCGYYACLLFTSILGLVMGPHPQRLAVGCILLIVAHIAAIHTLVFGHSRYHVPAMPLLAPFAVSALVQGRRLLQPHRRARLCAAAASCGVFALAWVTQFVTEDYLDFLTGGGAEVAATPPAITPAGSHDFGLSPRNGPPTQRRLDAG